MTSGADRPPPDRTPLLNRRRPQVRGPCQRLYGARNPVDHYETSALSSVVKAVLALTDAMVWVPRRVAPEVAAEVRTRCEDTQCLELVLDIARNTTNKIAMAFAADAPHVDDGHEIYEITADEAHYGPQRSGGQPSDPRG